MLNAKKSPFKGLKFTVFFVLLLICGLGVQSSSALDYYTRQSGPWSTPATWSNIGYGGAAAVGTPALLDIVHIGNGNIVTITAIATCATLNIDDTGTLQLGGFTLAVTGVTTVGSGASGVMTTVTSGAGTKTFTGAVTVNAGATWDLTGQNPATSFGGGITVNAGASFNNGTGATSFTATQTLAGAGDMTFGGTITPAALTTLTNNNTGTVTVSSTGSVVLTGNFTQGVNSTLSVQATTPFSGAGTLNANTNANVVNYSGGAQTIKNITYSTLTLSNAGTKTFAGSTPVSVDFNMSGATFTNSNIPTVGGNFTLTGTAQVITNSATVLSKQLNIGTGTKLTMGNFAFTVTQTTSVTGQLLTQGANSGTRTFTGAVTVNAGGIWNLSGTSPATSFGAGITMNGTTFNNGTGATAFSATQALAGTAAMTFGGVMTPAGGTTLTNNNTSTVTASNSITLTGNFTQGTNSTLLLTGATPFSGGGTFNASTNVNTVNYGGAAQTVKAVTYSTLALSGSGVKTMTGVSTINGNFTLSGTVSATPNVGLNIGGNVTLGVGTTFVAGALTHSVAGDWLNNGGTFTNTNSTIAFDGTTQNIGGTTPTTFNNLTIDGNGTTTFSLVTTISNTFDIEEGAMVNLGGLTTHTANVLKLSGNGESAGTWGGTGSGATNIVPAYFAAAAGRITIAVNGSQTLPYVEIFDGEANNTTQNASPPWSVTQFPSGGTFSVQSPALPNLSGTGFEISGTGAQEGVWQTADLDIGAGISQVGISLDIATQFTAAGSDYVNVYYVWDGGLSTSETLVGSVTSASSSPLAILNSTGHTKIRVVVRAKETTNFFGLFFWMSFDNVTIFPIRTLYSRATAAWSASGTWSLVGINGVDCTCTPSASGYDEVFIGGGKTVSLTGAGIASEVTVYGTADAGGAGTLNLTNQTLNVDYGGDVTVNAGGIITGIAGSDLAVTDGHSHTFTDNGSITVGAVDVTNGSQYSVANYTFNGAGTFSVLGNFTEANAFDGTTTSIINMPMTIGGTTTAPGTGFLFGTGDIVNNSTVTMTGTGANTLTGAGSWTQNANSTLNFAGASMNITTLDAGSAVNLVNYDQAGPQTVDNQSYWNLTLSNSGAKTLGGNINVAGNWTRSGTATFNPNSNGVTLDGTVAQTINNAETFFDLTTNNTTGGLAPQITMSGNVTVSDILTMTSGVVNLNSFTLNLTSTAAGALVHSGASSAGWAYNGTISRSFGTAQITIGNVTGLIPIGTSKNFQPFYFAKSNTGGSSGTISMTHADAATTTTGLSIADTNPVATIITRRNITWVSTLTGGTGATFGVRYGGTGIGQVASLTHLRAMLLNSVVGTNVAASGSTTDFRVERSTMTVAQMSNTFYVGSTNAATTLPVEIVGFEGVAQPYGVVLTWKTLSELMNDHFTVLRQTPEGEYKEIGIVKGNGTTNETNEYSLIDYKPLIGRNYYKLSQTDFDGQTYTHGIVMVQVYTLNGIQVSIYPNPVSKNRQIGLEMKGLDPAGSIEYEIIDMRGMTVKRGIGVADEAGSVKASIDFTDGAAGMYILKAPGGQFKFVVE